MCMQYCYFPNNVSNWTDIIYISECQCWDSFFSFEKGKTRNQRNYSLQERASQLIQKCRMISQNDFWSATNFTDKRHSDWKQIGKKRAEMFVAGDVLQIHNNTCIFAKILLFFCDRWYCPCFFEKMFWRFRGAINDLSHQTKIGFMCSN